MLDDYLDPLGDQRTAPHGLREATFGTEGGSPWPPARWETSPVRVETRYAKSGELSIAYQVVGEGPLDLVFVMGWVSHLDWFWEEPSFARFLRRLASFSRLILFDKRGTGLSDRLPSDRLPTLC